MMAKHAKEKTLDFYYLNQVEDHTKKEKPKNTKRAGDSRPQKKTTQKRKKTKAKTDVETAKKELFDFDREIVIGVNVLPDPKKDKPSGQKKNTKKRSTKETNAKKQPQKKQAQPKAKAKTKGQTTQKVKAKSKSVAKGPKKETIITDEEMGKRDKRVKRIKRVLKGFLFLIILVGIGSFFLISPIFNVKEVSVQGNAKITSEEITSLAGITIGENSFRFFNQQVENKVKQNAYIKEVKMNRKLPDKVILTVKERQPMFQILFGDSYVYIDSQGYLLETAEQTNEKPILKGYTTKEEEFQPGKRLNEEDLEKLTTIIKIMESASSNGISELITQIDMANTDNYTLTLEQKGKKVYLGDGSQINDRILILKVILEKEEGNKGEVFLQDKEKVYFRAQT